MKPALDFYDKPSDMDKAEEKYKEQSCACNYRTVPEASPGKTSKPYSNSQACYNSTWSCRMCNC